MLLRRSLPTAIKSSLVESELLVEEHAREAVAALAEKVEHRFDDELLAKLWAAEQIRRTMERRINALLAEARGVATPWTRQTSYTWERLGNVLGMSPQGARLRLLRRRTPVDPPTKPGTLVAPDYPKPSS